MNVAIVTIDGLRSRLILLLPEQCPQADTGYLDDFESDTRDITLGVTATAEAGDEDLIVLVDEVEATVVGDEASDLLTVLDELHSRSLTDCTVGLLGLDTDLLDDDALGVGGASQRIVLVDGAGV